MNKYNLSANIKRFIELERQRRINAMMIELYHRKAMQNIITELRTSV